MPIRRRDLLPAGLLLIGAPSIGVSVIARTSAALANEQDEMRRFFKSEYTYCDARVLAGYWNQSVGEAKARIGRKLGWGDVPVIKEMLGNARVQALPKAESFCPFYENDYSMYDMESLARFWRKDLGETKTKAARMLVRGQRKALSAEVHKANKQAGKDRPNVPGQHAALEQYSKAGYTYCDALVLGPFWNKGTTDTKLAVGNKLIAGQQRKVQKAFAHARKESMSKAAEICPYHEHGYSYADMESLALYWGEPIGQVKVSASRKLVGGARDLLVSELKAARRARQLPKRAPTPRKTVPAKPL